MALRKAGGNWVAGERFFDREVEIEALIERVEDGTPYARDRPAADGKNQLGARNAPAPRGDEATSRRCSWIWRTASTAADAVVEIAAASLTHSGPL